MKEDSSHHCQTFLIGHEFQPNDRNSPSPIAQIPDRSEEMDSSGTKAELRKSNKPIMEKRRRARINNCLNDLKGILLEAMRKDPARHSKLEKADILELTVRHLQNVQRNQLAIAMASDPTVLHRFKNGFSECATEVSRYLGRLDIGDAGLKTRVSSHLNGCISGLQQVNPSVVGAHPVQVQYPASVVQPVPHVNFGTPTPPNPATLPVVPTAQYSAPQPIPVVVTGTSPGDANNNKMHQGQRVVTQIQCPSPIQPSEIRHGSLSAFTSVTDPGSFIASPMSTTSSDTTLNTSISSSSDSSSLSFSSDKGSITSPIDFSLKPPQAPRSGQLRILKVEPLGKRSTASTIDKGHMWRPW